MESGHRFEVLDFLVEAGVDSVESGQRYEVFGPQVQHLQGMKPYLVQRGMEFSDLERLGAIDSRLEHWVVLRFLLHVVEVLKILLGIRIWIFLSDVCRNFRIL